MSSSVQYTRERLAEAADNCSSIDEVITFFGTEPYGKLGRYLLKRFAHFGIDISHFGNSGQLPRPTADELRKVVAESISIAGTLRLLGRPDSGTQRALLRRYIAEDHLATAHFLGQAHERGKPRPAAHRSHEEIWSSTRAVAGRKPTCSAACCARWAYRRRATNAVAGRSGSGSR